MTITYMDIISDFNLDLEDYKENKIESFWVKQNRKIKIYHVDQLHGLAFIGIKHFDGGPEIYAAYRYVTHDPGGRFGKYLVPEPFILEKKNRSFITNTKQPARELDFYEVDIIKEFVWTFISDKQRESILEILETSPKANIVDWGAGNDGK